MRCHYDDRIAQFRCARTGEYVCLDHARLDVVSVSTRTRLPPVPVRAALAEDSRAIREMALLYWGETEVACFGRTYDVTVLPAFVAGSESAVAGFLTYALEASQMVIVMLNVHPESQGRTVARSLLALAEDKARVSGLGKMVVATTNDDLPAQYLYQRWGFVVQEVVPGAVLAHHGHEVLGFARIPVRDEFRLEKRLVA